MAMQPRTARMRKGARETRLLLWMALFAAAALLPGMSDCYQLPTCTTDSDCGGQSFCAPKTELPGGGAGDGAKLEFGDSNKCLPCWMCCSLEGAALLPPGSGSSECSSHCRCKAGKRCSSDADCSSGELCDYKPAPGAAQGTCAGCSSCAEGAEGCSPACKQLGELAAYVGGRPEADLFLLPSSPDAMFVQRWLPAYTGTNQSAAEVIDAANRNPNARISPWTLLGSAAGFSDTCFSAAGSQSLLRTVAPGCPCDPSSSVLNGGTGMCPSGSYCGLSQSALTDGSPICLPCPTGTFCPHGTAGMADITAYLCPEGHYCPTPSEKLACRTGDFCPLGSVSPHSCGYLTLFAEDFSSVRIFKETNVLNELIYGRKPWGGNHCPGEAIDPFQNCPGGLYCPDPSSWYVCPAGSKCPSPSQEPQECSSLILSCPEGSSKGSISILGIVICLGLSLGLVILIVATWVFYKYLQHRQTKEVQKTDAYMKVKRIILETRASLHPLYLQKLLKSPMKTCEVYLRSKGAVDLEFENLGLKLRNGKTVLDGVSGRFDSRKLVAIMGPSGAGKSTFLNVLCGKADSYGKTTGTLRINGETARSVNDKPGKRAVGFVPQDDIVHEDLTVRENIWLSAMARLPSHLKKRQKQRIVEEVLFSLKLEHIEHSIVGSVEQRGISGGQRKRVNIGLELAALPTLLFLDEPTSGLDSTASTDVMDTLKQCANLGMTVMTVIHQPRYSIFTSFDDVLFLGRGGKTVYLGPTMFAATYFENLGFTLPENDNPADFCIDVLSGSMRREGDMNFKPDDLFAIWNEEGVKEVEKVLNEQMMEKQEEEMMGMDKGYTGRLTEVMPRDVQCMANIFRDIDTDGDDMVTPDQVMEYFRALDLTMDEKEVLKFCAGNSVLSKADFLALMRNGPVEESRRKRKKRSKHSKHHSKAKQQPRPPQGFSSTSHQSMHKEGSTSSRIADKALDNICEDGDASPMVSAQTAEDFGTAAEPVEEATPESVVLESRPIADGLEDDSGDDTEEPLQGTDTMRRTVRFDAPSSTCTDSVAGPSAFSSPPSRLSIRSETSMMSESTDGPPSPDLESGGGLEEGGDSPLPSGHTKPHRLKCLTDLTRVAVQTVLLTYTRAIQWVRSWSSKVLAYIMLAIAGALLGAILRRHNDKDVVPLRSLLAQLTLALLCGIPSLQVFSNARAMWWRQRSSGFSPTGHVLAGMLIDTFDVVIRPMVFNSMFYFFILPYISFWESYKVLLGTSWYASGLAYAFSSLMAPGSASISLVCSIMVIGGLFSGVLPHLATLRKYPFLYYLHSISYTRWGSEALTALEFARQEPYQQPPLALTLYGLGYCDMDIKLENIGEQVSAGFRLVLEEDETKQQVQLLKDALESSIEGNESFISLQCASYIRRDLLWLFLLGVGFRLVAFLAMRWIGRRG